MTYVITEACIGAKHATCVDVCPVDCIHEREDQFHIDADECIDCAACEQVCPVAAIFPDTELPAGWSGKVEKNEGRCVQAVTGGNTQSS